MWLALKRLKHGIKSSHSYHKRSIIWPVQRVSELKASTTAKCSRQVAIVLYIDRGAAHMEGRGIHV